MSRLAQALTRDFLGHCASYKFATMSGSNQPVDLGDDFFRNNDVSAHQFSAHNTLSVLDYGMNIAHNRVIFKHIRSAHPNDGTSIAFTSPAMPIFQFRREIFMSGMGDKLKGKGNEVKGKVKQEYGEQTDDPDMTAEGKGDEMKGKAQQIKGKAKDKIDDVKDKVRD